MQKNQNVFLFYVRVLLYCLVALLIRAAALAPLAALFVFPADSLWRWLWVVSPLMVVFLVLPLRFSFADALVQRPRTRDFSIDGESENIDVFHKKWYTHPEFSSVVFALKGWIRWNFSNRFLKAS